MSVGEFSNKFTGANSRTMCCPCADCVDIVFIPIPRFRTSNCDNEPISNGIVPLR
jgi:hypothetical protein